MTDYYQPRSWIDGELLTAANAANRWEQGIESLDGAIENLEEQVANLQVEQPTRYQIQSGTMTQAPAPLIGTLYYATDLGTQGKLVLGTGSKWINPDGTDITGSGGGVIPGTGTTPQNMRATTGPGGSIGVINLAWDAVNGATSYKLYETESPNGVSGSTALTTTTSTRSSLSQARTYQYWVTATVNGVESAASNKASATLPHQDDGGPPPTGSSPSALLNINGLGNGQGGWWKLQFGRAGATSNTDISATQLANGFTETPYYILNSTGTAVQFHAPMNGGVTENSGYPRSELREMREGSTALYSWNTSSGRRILRGRTRLIHCAPNKPEVCIAQIHGSDDDWLQLRLEGSSNSGPFNLELMINGTGVKNVATGIALGAEVQWEIDVNAGQLTTRVNGVVQDTRIPSGWGNGAYWKVGCYAQQNTSNGNPSSEYARTELRDLFMSHS